LSAAAPDHADDAVRAAAGLRGPGRLRRRPSPYRSSFPIEELEVERDNGEGIALAFKRLDWDELDDRARVAKPRFLHDPEREALVYELLLPAAPAGPPRFHASLLEPGCHWLFVEWVAGRELYQVGERELWEDAARWLAGFHRQFAAEPARFADRCRLLRRDGAFYRSWISRAREFSHEPGGPSPAVVEWLADRHEPVVEALLALPQTIVHGEFYASNVLVDDRAMPVRVAPVDWELTGTGPGLLDLAALVGGWPAADRAALAAAYAGSDAEASPESLELARLQVAIQWLGWAPPAWRPPASQRHDWAAEAVAIAEGLGL
jgi:aminoglycoside phosphotransferase (APT) family kinase protein